MKLILLHLLIWLGFATGAWPQNMTEYNSYASRYKDNDVVYLNIKTEIIVDLGNKGLKIQEAKYEETFYNSFKAAAYAENTIKSSEFAKIKDIEASTLLPENNKFREIKVKDFTTRAVLDEDIFYQDLYSTFFVYPSLRQGAITRLKYTLDISEPFFFPGELVKRGYPVENFEFVINTQKDVVLDTKYFNTDSSKIEYSKVAKGDRIIYTWKASKISGFRTEPNSPDHMCYLPQIIPYIHSYKLNNKDVTVFRNVDDLFHWKNKFLTNIDHRHTVAMTETVNSILKNCTSDIAKVGAIYHWVQNNIKYVANEYAEGGLVPRDPYIVYEKRYGDCKDMSAIIIEMLDIAGIKAYYTWLGTRALPYSYKDIPTTRVTNHMIATCILNNNYYFLDATDTYLPLGLPSEAIQGKEAMIRYDNDKYEIYKVPEVPSDSNVQTENLTLNISQGKLIGKGNLQLKGYYYPDMKHQLEKIKDAAEKSKIMRSYLQTGNNKCVINKYTIEEANKSLLINYEFSLTDYVLENGNEIYVNLNLSQPFQDFELIKNDRQLDVEIAYKSQMKRNYTFTIPEGYSVTYLPKNTEFDGGDYSYAIAYEIKGNTVIYHFSLSLDTLRLKSQEFSKWNNMIKQMRSDFKEVLVLKNHK